MVQGFSEHVNPWHLWLVGKVASEDQRKSPGKDMIELALEAGLPAGKMISVPEGGQGRTVSTQPLTGDTKATQKEHPERQEVNQKNE